MPLTVTMLCFHIPLTRLGRLGERYSSSSGSGRSPVAKRILVQFTAKIRKSVKVLPTYTKCPMSMQHFWATVCKTVPSVLPDRCPVCDVVVLWPNGWMDQLKMKLGMQVYASALPHCVRWGPCSPSPKGTEHPIFGPYLL